MYDDDCPAAHEAEVTFDTLRSLPEGRYRMRVTADDASLQFLPGFSFRQSGKLFVLFPDEEANQTAMGVVAAPKDSQGSGDEEPCNRVTPAMIEAGIRAHMECDPTVFGYPFEERIVSAIYTAMASAQARDAE